MVISLWQSLYYGLLIPAMHTGAKIMAQANAKVSTALEGQRVPQCQRPELFPRIWFHVSSLGEFEQAKPIIEALKVRYPEQGIWVSFFSPSGHDYASGYEHAEELFYLPMRRSELRRTFTTIDPHMVVVVKVDLWPGLSWEASLRGVPVVLVDGTLTPRSIRNSRIVRSMERSYYSCLTGVAAVSDKDAGRIQRLCGDTVPISVTGDSKFDRVWTRAARSRSLGVLDTVLAHSPVPILVAGSTYESEEQVLAHALDQIENAVRRVSVVVVPHEPTENRLGQAERLLGGRQWKVRRLSRLSPEEKWNVLLIDKVGILAETYRHADMVFVGGSFKAKVHNVVEPAIFGKPIVVGPRFQNSPEAVAMIEQGSLLTVANADQLSLVLNRWLDCPLEADRLGTSVRAFVESRRHASERIVDFIESWLPQSTIRPKRSRERGRREDRVYR